MTNPTLRIYSFIYEKFLLAQGSALVLCTKFNVQIGAGRPVNTNGVWPNFLVWSPPWIYASSVKNKNKTLKPGKLVDNEIIVSQFLRYFSWRIQCLFLTSASLFGTTPRVTGSSWTHSGLTGKKEKRRMHKIWAKRDGISLCNQGCRSRSAQQGAIAPRDFGK